MTSALCKYLEENKAAGYGELSKELQNLTDAQDLNQQVFIYFGNSSVFLSFKLECLNVST